MFNLIPWKRKHVEPSRSGSLVADPLERRLTQFRDDFDSLWDRFWSGGLLDQSWSQNGLGWNFDAVDQDDAFLVRAEAPGFEANDFDVQVRGNYLTIRAERKEEQNGNGRSHYHYGQFERMTLLPQGVDADNVSASYHNGVLELRLPKKEEARGKRINVQAK
jgi:HSP20 family protein